MSMPPAVEAKFADYPVKVQKAMRALRQLILEVAENTPGVGCLEETLKWGEPAYLTSKSKSGTTIRIDWKPKTPDQYGLYVHCQTSLIEQYRTLFADHLRFEGNRAIIFSLDEPLPEDEVRSCIQMALCYHQR